MTIIFTVIFVTKQMHLKNWCFIENKNSDNFTNRKPVSTQECKTYGVETVTRTIMIENNDDKVMRTRQKSCFM